MKNVTFKISVQGIVISAEWNDQLSYSDGAHCCEKYEVILFALAMLEFSL
jgi:hypothetical protein